LTRAVRLHNVAGVHRPFVGNCMSEPRETEKPSETEKLTETTPPVPRPASKEIGGPKGPEPTRYGDWEVNGRCSDF
jgi:hypothetical protein